MSLVVLTVVAHYIKEVRKRNSTRNKAKTYMYTTPDMPQDVSPSIEPRFTNRNFRPLAASSTASFQEKWQAAVEQISRQHSPIGCLAVLSTAWMNTFTMEKINKQTVL